jgi:hypothetical protein
MITQLPYKFTNIQNKVLYNYLNLLKDNIVYNICYNKLIGIFISI